MRPQVASKLLITAVSLLSLGWITTIDNIALWAMGNVGVHTPHFRIPSLLATILLVAALDSKILQKVVKPEMKFSWRKASKPLFFWFLPMLIYVFFSKSWIAPQLRGPPDLIPFLITGLLCEELLFRGLIFEMSQRLSSRILFWDISLPVLISSIGFSLQHLQYHGWEITAPSVAQISFTFFMGIFFGIARERSGSLKVPIAAHFANNAIVVLAMYLK